MIFTLDRLNYFNSQHRFPFLAIERDSTMEIVHSSFHIFPTTCDAGMDSKCTPSRSKAGTHCWGHVFGWKDLITPRSSVIPGRCDTGNGKGSLLRSDRCIFACWWNNDITWWDDVTLSWEDIPVPDHHF